jgi:hypothetical protein
MAKKADIWKPCDELTPDDFERSAIWGFDLRRSRDAGAVLRRKEDYRAPDETFVRPMAPRDSSEIKDAIFLQATLRTPAQASPFAGAIALRFASDPITMKRSMLPTLEAVVLLRPYASFAVFEGTIGTEAVNHELVLRTAAGDLSQQGTMLPSHHAHLIEQLALRQRVLPLSYDATLRIGVNFFRLEGTLR